MFTSLRGSCVGFHGNELIWFGAEAGTRTPTPLRALDPESDEAGLSKCANRFAVFGNPASLITLRACQSLATFFSSSQSSRPICPTFST